MFAQDNQKGFTNFNAFPHVFFTRAIEAMVCDDVLSIFLDVTEFLLTLFISVTYYSLTKIKHFILGKFVDLAYKAMSIFKQSNATNKNLC